MNTQLALVPPGTATSHTVVINARCTLRREDEQCVIVVGGLPVHHYRADDSVAQAYAMVLLVESGFSQPTEVARAFSIAERTVRRYQERYAQDGGWDERPAGVAAGGVFPQSGCGTWRHSRLRG
jgi:hypothetical protein